MDLALIKNPQQGISRLMLFSHNKFPFLDNIKKNDARNGRTCLSNNLKYTLLPKENKKVHV